MNNLKQLELEVRVADLETRANQLTYALEKLGCHVGGKEPFLTETATLPNVNRFIASSTVAKTLQDDALTQSKIVQEMDRMLQRPLPSNGLLPFDADETQ